MHAAQFRVVQAPPETRSNGEAYCPASLSEKYRAVGVAGAETTGISTLDLRTVTIPYIAPGAKWADWAVPQRVITSLAHDENVVSAYPGIATCTGADLSGDPGVVLPLSTLAAASTRHFRVGQGAPP